MDDCIIVVHRALGLACSRLVALAVVVASGDAAGAAPDDFSRNPIADGARCGRSDAGAHASQLCDACTPTYLLARWVREKGAITIEEAVRMLTSRPAEVFGITDRGRLAAGVPADGAVRPEDLQAFIADRLPYYEHLHHVDLVDTIPRSPTGRAGPYLSAPRKAATHSSSCGGAPNPSPAGSP